MSARRRAAVQLQYPTLSLYRSLLRAHQNYLPTEARELGDAYVKKEFQLHRGASPEFLQQFERQWRDYLTHIRREAGKAQPGDALGREMTSEEVGALSDEQKVQLMKIHDEVTGSGTDPSKA